MFLGKAAFLLNWSHQICSPQHADLAGIKDSGASLLSEWCWDTSHVKKIRFVRGEELYRNNLEGLLPSFPSTRVGKTRNLPGIHFHEPICELAELTCEPKSGPSNLFLNFIRQFSSRKCTNALLRKKWKLCLSINISQGILKVSFKKKVSSLVLFLNNKWVEGYIYCTILIYFIYVVPIVFQVDCNHVSSSMFLYKDSLKIGISYKKKSTRKTPVFKVPWNTHIIASMIVSSNLCIL